jgi:nucleoside-diphosphate-sugar epimerase
MPVWLVTGGSGFLGRHLLAALDACRSPSCAVVVAGRRCPEGWPSQRFLEVDLAESLSVVQALGSIEPEVVIHLAGKNPPATPDELYRTNTVATAHLLDALGTRGLPTRVVLAGSAAELGPVDEVHLPVADDHPCRPIDAYGRSKWLATAAGLSMPPPIEVVVARVFNPIGPGMSETQALGRFATRLAMPGALVLTVGALTPRRDFVDARDVAQALIALARDGQPGTIYNVGTGASHAVGEGLEELISLRGGNVEARVDPSLAARSGPRDSRADIRRIGAHTGWRPQIPWERSLADLWADVRVGG